MIRYLTLLAFFAVLWPAAANAQQPRTSADSLLQALQNQVKKLQQKVSTLEEKQEQAELEKLLQEAEAAAAEKPKAAAKTKVFRGGQRALQALNPEISVTGDYLGEYIAERPHYQDDELSGHHFRVLGIHFRSDLDPFSYTKIAVEVHPEGAELGEAYVVWSGEIPGVSFTVGKFRQQFGVVNRWHAHSLDQAFFPLAIQTLFGPEGLNQTGVALDWTVPQWGPVTQYLTVQLTNGQNPRLFSGEAFSKPALLIHLKNYRDLTRDTYAELGVTGMVGENRVADPSAPLLNSSGAPGHQTLVLGADLTLFWEPLNRAHYKNFLWRSEVFYVRKNLPLGRTLKALGGYSYIQRKISERTELGLRGDWTQPFALDNSGKYLAQIVPYLTWWQSHWVRLRLEWQHRTGNVLARAQNRIWLQITWAAGPHKHERY